MTQNLKSLLTQATQQQLKRVQLRHDAFIVNLSRLAPYRYLIPFCPLEWHPRGHFTMFCTLEKSWGTLEGSHHVWSTIGASKRALCLCFCSIVLIMAYVHQWRQESDVITHKQCITLLKVDLFSNLHIVTGNSPQENNFETNNRQIVSLCLVIAFKRAKSTSCLVEH